jgi:hypothetical protein
MQIALIGDSYRNGALITDQKLNMLMLAKVIMLMCSNNFLKLAMFGFSNH